MDEVKYYLYCNGKPVSEKDGKATYWDYDDKGELVPIEVVSRTADGKLTEEIKKLCATKFVKHTVGDTKKVVKEETKKEETKKEEVKKEEIKKEEVKKEEVKKEETKKEEETAEKSKKDKKVVNWKALKRIGCLTVPLVIAGSIGAGHLIARFSDRNTTIPVTYSNTRIEQPAPSYQQQDIDTMPVYEETTVERLDNQVKVTVIDTDRIEKRLPELCSFIKNNLSENVSDESICALYYIVNYSYLTENAKQTMINNDLVSTDTSTVFTEALECLSTIQNYSRKYIQGEADGKLCPYQNFCENSEDAQLLRSAYNQLAELVYASEKPEEVGKAFDEFCQYLLGEKTETFKIGYNETAPGASFLIRQGFGPAYSIAMGEAGLIGEQSIDDEEYIDEEYIEDYVDEEARNDIELTSEQTIDWFEERINQIDTVYKMIDSCDIEKSKSR